MEAEHPSSDQKPRDHSAWVSWLIITLGLLFITSFTLRGDGIKAFLLLGAATFLAGLYTLYIFRGGMFVIVFTWMEMLAKLFTYGYTKNLSPEEPPSKAWIIWAMFTASAVYTAFVALQEISTTASIFYLGVSLLGGWYTYYLFGGGRRVYVPLIVFLWIAASILRPFVGI